MSHPTRAAWWPAAVAGLLLASGGGWLWRAFPGPPAAHPLAAPRATGLPAPDSAGATTAAVAPAAKPPQTPADTAIRFTAYNLLAGDTLASPLTEHRYVGTLGGRAIVVQLSAGANSARGSWYYRTGQQAHERLLAFRGRRGGQLVLDEAITTTTPTNTAAAEWRLSWPLGRVLTGERRAVRGAGRQAVQLRASYTQAVPYQLLGLTAQGSRCEALPGRSQPYYSAEFVRLPSADSLRLDLWQAPPPAARRDSLRHWLGRESCQQTSQHINVRLNDYDLFSYNVFTEAYYYGTHPEHDQQGFIVDLRTGNEWLVEELLRPGTEAALLKLLAHHLRHDYPEMSQGDHRDWKTVPPYPDSFTLTPSGLCAGYGDYDLVGYASFTANTTIPYRELRPLVRPGTPLARLLRARGMW
jgi:hypothetical protein